MKTSRRFETGLIAKCALLMSCGLLAATGALGQSGGSGAGAVPCMVNYLRVRIATGGDDLRGWDGMSSSKDNLDVTVYFGDKSSQLAPDVNNNSTWKSNTVHLVVIKLNPAVPIDEIKGIKLQHTGSGLGFSSAAATGLPGAGIQTADNWDMDWVEVMAEGTGASARVAAHGAKRFTGQDRVLDIRAEIPANSCEAAEGIGRLNPGIRNLQSTNGAGSKYGTQKSAPSTIQPAPRSGSQPTQNNRLIQQALAHTVQVGPRASVAESNGSYTATIAIIKRQSAAARSLLVPAVRPVSTNSSGPLLNGGTSQILNPQPYPLKGSSPQITAGQTMSGTGAPPTTSRSSALMSNVQSGSSAHQRPNSPKPQTIAAGTPMPTQLCKAGIATVDGGTSGIWFSPVAGQDGTFVIQGCGFGATPGQVYLSGVKYAPQAQAIATPVVTRSMQHPERVSFQVSPNSWSDRRIVAQIDPNAGGLYDTNNATLVVATANGQTYQSTGMNFLAAREDQTLKALPKNAGCTPQSTGPACIPVGVSLVSASSSNGPVAADVESPSLNLLRPGATVAVARESASSQFPIPMTPGFSFRGGLDSYQFNFAPGFQLDQQRGVQLRHSSADSDCQSVNGVYSNSGSWGVKYTSPASFQVYWEEEGCWPETAISSGNSLDVLNYASVSAYELDITVFGPRGISPWPSVNPMAIKQPTQRPQLLAH